jgi:hypothetical protein
MADSNKSHISNAVREALDKQIPEIRRGVLEVADKDLKKPDAKKDEQK